MQRNVPILRLAKMHFPNCLKQLNTFSVNLDQNFRCILLLTAKLQRYSSDLLLVDLIKFLELQNFGEI